jgi:hypothetical protein
MQHHVRYVSIADKTPLICRDAIPIYIGIASLLFSIINSKSGSVSRVLYPFRDGDHYTGPIVANRLCRQVSPSACNLPAGLRPGRATGMLGLAGGGVCRAVAVTDDAVRSYRTISPLPTASRPKAVYFLWHCPAGHPGRPLAATVPCPARTFL